MMDVKAIKNKKKEGMGGSGRRNATGLTLQREQVIFHFRF